MNKALILALLLLSPASVFAQNIDVPAGGNLQLALNNAVPGQTILLAPGAVYTGNFKLPAKDGTAEFITVTTNGQLPAAGTRITPAAHGTLAIIQSPNGAATIATSGTATYWRFVGVEILGATTGGNDIVVLGNSAESDVSKLAAHFDFDRVLISGDPVKGNKRGIAANAADVTIENSDIRECKGAGYDTQAILAWATPGPLVIRNNHLEGAGENIMIGGAGVKMPGVIPSDITVEDNEIVKPLSWRGSQWTIKNLFELKTGVRVVVRHNLLMNNWLQAQAGWAVVFTPRNADVYNPWFTISDVLFENNLVIHAGGGVNMIGRDDKQVTVEMARVTVRNNLFLDINSKTWGGTGHFVQIAGGRDIVIDHNTVEHNGNLMVLYNSSYPVGDGTRVTDGQISGFTFTNNLARLGYYGIFGQGASGMGTVALAKWAPGYTVTGNVLFAGSSNRVSTYPTGNTYPPAAGFLATFKDAAGFDFSQTAYPAAGFDPTVLQVVFPTPWMDLLRPLP
jgi:hypothetical protein